MRHLRLTLILPSLAAGLACGNGSTENSPTEVATTTYLVSSANPSYIGEPLQLTATISSVAGTPTGTVTFQDAGADIVNCVNLAVTQGSTTCTTNPSLARHLIRATFTGTGRFLSSYSILLDQAVVRIPAQVTVLGPASSIYNQALSFTARVTGGQIVPDGFVVFKDNDAVLPGCEAVTLVAREATCFPIALGAGPHSLTATYAGFGLYTAGTSAPVLHTIAKAPSVTLIGATSYIVAAGQPDTLIAIAIPGAQQAGGRATGAIAFQADGANIPGCSLQPLDQGVATCVVTFLSVGSRSVMALYLGDANLVGSVSDPTLLVVTQPGPTSSGN